MSTAVLPDHSQALQALEMANRVRLARADLKRAVKVGDLTAAAVILDPPWFAQRMEIGDLLRSQNYWGRTRMRRFLQPFMVSETRHLVQVSSRQRLAIAAALRRICGTPDECPAASAGLRNAPLSSSAEANFRLKGGAAGANGALNENPRSESPHA